VITQAQSDAIVGALESAFEERQAEAEARMEEMRRTWEQVQGFMDDGVISQDEVDTLPEGNALRDAFNSIAENGQITIEQLRELGPGLAGPGFGVRGEGHGRGEMRFRVDGPNGPGLDLAPDSGSDSDGDAGADS
jgi:hypothetical protein